MINIIIKIVHLDRVEQKQQADLAELTELFEQNAGLIPSKDADGLYIEIYDGLQTDGINIIKIPPIK